MTNKEKYGNEIIELAANTALFGLKNGKPAICEEIKCEECDFMNQIRAKVVRIISANGLIQNMLSRLLIGVKLQSIRRFW